MKVSIVIQHYNRKNLLINTLNSIKESLVKKSDIEIVITDDASNPEHNLDDLIFLYPDFDVKIHTYSEEEKWWTCPVIPANKGISMASGDVIILLGAECMFIGDIVKDVIDRIKPNDYLVYSVLALNEEDTNKIPNYSYRYLVDNKFEGDWYQHSIHNNNCYNFCTAIMREDLMDLGGFDERYAGGVEYGDNDFILRVRRKGMNVISVDEPMSYHQNHEGMSYANFEKKVNNEKVNNFSGALLYDYVLKNESGYKVKNSYLENPDLIYLEPELEEKYVYTEFKVILKMSNRNLFVEFLCNASGMKMNVIGLDSIENGRSILFNNELQSQRWFSFDIDCSEIRLSIQDIIFYQNSVLSDLDYVGDYTLPIKLLIPVKK